MKNTRKNTGWVIKNRKKGTFVANCNHRYSNTKVLEKSEVYPTRAEARFEYFPEENEVVLKVATNDDGFAVEIIGGNGTGCRF